MYKLSFSFSWINSVNFQRIFDPKKVLESSECLASLINRGLWVRIRWKSQLKCIHAGCKLSFSTIWDKKKVAWNLLKHQEIFNLLMSLISNNECYQWQFYNFDIIFIYLFTIAMDLNSLNFMIWKMSFYHMVYSLDSSLKKL